MASDDIICHWCFEKIEKESDLHVSSRISGLDLHNECYWHIRYIALAKRYK
jgi:hypothetical protein